MHFLWTLLGVCSGMKFHRLALGWTPVDALKHLLKLALVLTLVATPLVIRDFLRAANSTLARMDGDGVLPAFSIEHGRVRAAVPQPYCGRLQNFAFVLDTTGATPLVATGATSGVTVTADKLTVWAANGMQPQVIPLNYFPDGRVNAAYLGGLLEEATPWMAAVIAVAIFTGFFFATLLQVVLFGGVAALVEQGIEPGYRFDQLLSFGVLAVTPASIIALAYAACGVALDNISLTYFIVFAFYFTGATTVCRVLLLPPGARADDDD
jgi:Protein of unknown function (DUF1189)